MRQGVETLRDAFPAEAKRYHPSPQQIAAYKDLAGGAYLTEQLRIPNPDNSPEQTEALKESLSYANTELDRLETGVLSGFITKVAKKFLTKHRLANSDIKDLPPSAIGSLLERSGAHAVETRAIHFYQRQLQAEVADQAFTATRAQKPNNEEIEHFPFKGIVRTKDIPKVIPIIIQILTKGPAGPKAILGELEQMGVQIRSLKMWQNVIKEFTKSGILNTGTSWDRRYMLDPDCYSDITETPRTTTEKESDERFWEEVEGIKALLVQNEGWDFTEEELLRRAGLSVWDSRYSKELLVDPRVKTMTSEKQVTFRFTRQAQAVKKPTDPEEEWVSKVGLLYLNGVPLSDAIKGLKGEKLIDAFYYALAQKEDATLVEDVFRSAGLPGAITQSILLSLQAQGKIAIYRNRGETRVNVIKKDREHSLEDVIERGVAEALDLLKQADLPMREILDKISDGRRLMRNRNATLEFSRRLRDGGATLVDKGVRAVYHLALEKNPKRKQT